METLEVGDMLLFKLTEEKRNEWKNTVEDLEMRTNSNKCLIRKLNYKNRNEPKYTNVTVSEVY